MGNGNVFLFNFCIKAFRNRRVNSVEIPFQSITFSLRRKNSISIGIQWPQLRTYLVHNGCWFLCKTPINRNSKIGCLMKPNAKETNWNWMQWLESAASIVIGRRCSTKWGLFTWFWHRFSIKHFNVFFVCAIDRESRAFMMASELKMRLNECRSLTLSLLIEALSMDNASRSNSSR